MGQTSGVLVDAETCCLSWFESEDGRVIGLKAWNREGSGLWGKRQMVIDTSNWN